MKHDGSPTDPEAKYLVLRIDNKPGRSPEWAALRAYLDAIAEKDPRLHFHLVNFFIGEAYDASAGWSR